MIRTEVENIRDEVIKIRRDIHQHPEIGFQETLTAALVADYLTQLGMDVKTGVAKTGVVGLLRGATAGKTLLLRADMDALPIQEKSEKPYKSVFDGTMHACGHDGHVAMLLGAAKILSAHPGDFKGNIKFAFQPGEEGYAGARSMIEEGLLDNPSVDAAFALHLTTLLPTAHVSLRSGPMMASADSFNLTIKGASGHAANLNMGTDAIQTAAEIITTFPRITAKEIPANKAIIIHVGTISGGDARNIIAERVKMEGTVRALDSDLQRQIPGKMERIIDGITKASGADYVFEYRESYPVLNNDKDMTERVKTTCGRILGPEKVIEMSPNMGAEDMAFVLNQVPGCFFFIGAGNEEKGITAPNHSSKFDIDEEALIHGCEILVNLALDFLS